MDRCFLLVSLMGAYSMCSMGERLDTCPLMLVNKTLTNKQFYDFTRGLSDEDLIELYHKHKQCMNNRNTLQLCANKRYSAR